MQKIGSIKKPVILSTGMSNLDEIKIAFEILKENTDKIALLHCISAYPTKEIDANLLAISKLKESFNCVIGHSDIQTVLKSPYLQQLSSSSFKSTLRSIKLWIVLTISFNN